MKIFPILVILIEKESLSLHQKSEIVLITTIKQQTIMKTITFKISSRNDFFTFTEKCVNENDQLSFESNIRSFAFALEKLTGDICVTKIVCETINHPSDI